METVTEPITISRRNYCQDLDDLVKKGDLTAQLATLLKGVVNAEINDVIPPAAGSLGARGQIVEQARQHLKGGILLHDEGVADKMYELGVYIPEDPEMRRSLFRLLPKYPGGTILRLSEFNGTLNF